MHVTDLQAACATLLGDKASNIILAYGEITLECQPKNYLYANPARSRRLAL